MRETYSEMMLIYFCVIMCRMRGSLCSVDGLASKTSIRLTRRNNELNLNVVKNNGIGSVDTLTILRGCTFVLVLALFYGTNRRLREMDFSRNILSNISSRETVNFSSV